MRVLNISLDNKILDKNSAVAKRAIAYGNFLDKYSVLVPGENKILDLSSNTKVFGIKGKKKFFTLFKIYHYLNKHLKDNKYDLITIQDTYYLATVAINLANKFGIKSEIQVHGFEKLSFFRKMIAKDNLRRADRIRVVSQRLRKYLIESFAIVKNKIYVVPVYVDISSLKNKKIKFNLKDKYKDYFIFITVGRLVEIKNIRLQLEALKGINKKIKLIIIGDGPEKEGLVNLSNSLGLDNVVEFLGWQKDVSDYYKTADCLLLTSYSEGYPLVIVEAVSLDLPIIMTNVGNAGELVEDNKNGFIINNVQELRSKINILFDDPEIINKFKSNNIYYKNKIKEESEIINIIIGEWKKIL